VLFVEWVPAKRSASRFWQRHDLRAYAIGVVAAASAMLVRWPLDPWLGPGGVPFITFFPAVVVAALLGGVRSGLTAALGGAALAWFFVVEPHLPTAVERGPVYVGLAVYLAATAVIASVGGNVLAARDRARRAEERAQREQERLRVTVASIGDGLIASDADGRVTFLNPVAEQLTGWTTAEAAGRPLDEVFRIVHEDTRVPAENPARRALREGRVVGLANHTVLIARDGSERPIDDSAAPIVTAGDAVEGCVLVFRDVSQRRDADKGLRRSEERFRTLADNMAQLAWITDPSGALVWCNQRWLEFTGSKPDDMLGWGWQRVVHPDDLPRVMALVGDCLANGTVWEDTFRVHHADGSWGWFLARGVPGHDEDGRMLRWFGTGTDITRQRDAEDALRVADRRKDEFLATLAHELRNPLAPIRSSIELLKRTGGDPGSAAAALRTMERQVSHLVRLVDDLLDISRITRDKLELQTARVTLAEVLEPALEACRPLADAAQHTLSLQLAPEPIWLEADPVRLTQVFSNLLHNAVKYTPPGGRITLTVTRDGEQARVAVQDSGIGIAPGMAPQLFELFAQAPAPEHVHGGLGIGLSLVRRLVEMHGGRVEASSDGPGQGSEFVVWLPVAAAPVSVNDAAPVSHTVAAPAAAPHADAIADHADDRGDDRRAHDAPRAAAGATPARRRILVVDDNRDAAESLAMLLELGGDETRVVHDGLAALDAAEEMRPDVVLLDLGLPRLDGIEVARRLRATEACRHVLLIALTGWGQDDDRRKSSAAGFDHHLVKPVDHETLLALLDGADARRLGGQDRARTA
jgi:PAS domain S-box-containing protein